MLKLKTEKLCRNNEEIMNLSFGEDIVEVKQLEEQSLLELEIVGFNKKITLNSIAKIISRLLKGAFIECDLVLLCNIKFEKNLSEEDINKILFKNKDIIQNNIDGSLEISEASSF